MTIQSKAAAIGDAVKLHVPELPCGRAREANVRFDVPVVLQARELVANRRRGQFGDVVFLRATASELRVECIDRGLGLLERKMLVEIEPVEFFTAGERAQDTNRGRRERAVIEQSYGHYETSIS